MSYPEVSRKVDMNFDKMGRRLILEDINFMNFAEMLSIIAPYLGKSLNKGVKWRSRFSVDQSHEALLSDMSPTIGLPTLTNYGT